MSESESSAPLDLIAQMRHDFSDWRVVDDVVMGGVSSSTVRPHVMPDGHRGLRFAGEVSLERGGGFCSARCEGLDVDLTDHALLVIRARADRALRVKLTLRTPGQQASSWRHSFELPAGRAVERELALGDFELFRRGTQLSQGGLEPDPIVSVGLLVSDGQQGPFTLDLLGLSAR